MAGGPSDSRSPLTVNGQEKNGLELNLNLALNPSSSTEPLFNSPRITAAQESPVCPSSPLQAQSQSDPTSASMAFQRADPSPFIPQGMHLQNVEHRQFMVRAVVGTRPVLRHEDWAIATIQPLSGNILNFQAVRAVLEDFFC